jgi:hypothetical protein
MCVLNVLLRPKIIDLQGDKEGGIYVPSMSDEGQAIKAEGSNPATRCRVSIGLVGSNN